MEVWYIRYFSRKNKNVSFYQRDTKDKYSMGSVLKAPQNCHFEGLIFYENW